MRDAEAYEALAALAERELALVAGPELPDAEALRALMLERDALVASLPASAPAVAAPSLARAAAVQERVTAELAARAAEARRQLDAVERGRRTAAGYGAGPRRGALDVAG